MLELIFQGFAEWAYELVLECWEYFSTALLDINKGWKAVSNAIKGRLIPDDDQHTLAVTLLSTRTEGEERCHITLLPIEDAHDFFSAHSSDYASGDFYSGQWC